MTCKGYDPKAIKLPSSVKTASTFILDDHKRGAFIRAHKYALEQELKINQNRNKKNKD